MSFEKKITNQADSKEDTLKAAEILNTDKLSSKQQDIESKCTCSIRQFAYFHAGTSSQKKKIVRDQKTAPAESFFWYGKAYAAIRKCILKNDSSHIYQAISDFKKEVYESDELFNIRNRDYSIQALECFLKISLPMDFRQLSKIRILPIAKVYRLFGIAIRLSPDVLFKADYKGKKVVGAVRINIKRKPPLTSIRMKIVSFLLYKFLEKNIVSEGEVVLPEFCLCIDVFSERWMTAPSGTSAPNVILKEAAEEYLKLWQQS